MRKLIKKINIEKTAIWFSILLLIPGLGIGISGWPMFIILGLLLFFFCLLKRFYLIDIFAILLMFIRLGIFLASEMALIPNIPYFALFSTIVICIMIIANYFVIRHKIKLAKQAIISENLEKEASK